MTIRWGVAGTGRMATAFVEDLVRVPGCSMAAVGSRDRDRAYQFAAVHSQAATSTAHAHGSYQELTSDPDVDVIYIATPHPQHRLLALDAIAHRKAVLVEKSFCATLAGAKDVVDAAREHHVFAMEAMWTRFMPVIVALREIVASGTLGDIVSVQGDLLVYRRFNPRDRLFAPSLGGGALLDVGVYTISFAQMILGAPDRLEVAGHLYSNGVDASASLLLSYPSGAQATLSCALDAEGPGRMAVVGTRGWVEVLGQFHHPRTLVVHRPGVLAHEFELRPTGAGYSHEIVEVNRCLADGRLESSAMPLDDTLEVMKELEQALDALGVAHADADTL